MPTAFSISGLRLAAVAISVFLEIALLNIKQIIEV